MDQNLNNLVGKDIVIHRSRLKAIWFLGLAMAFCLGGIWLFHGASVQQRYKIVFVQAVASGCTLLGMAGIVFGFLNLLDSRARLVIDNEGIVDHVNGNGRIKWSDMIDIDGVSVDGAKTIIISIIDNADASTDSGMKIIHKAARAYYGKQRHRGNQLYIQPAGLRIGFNELLALLIVTLEEYKSKSGQL